MKIYLSAFISGLFFAVGLGLSGMMSPQKVQGFLDLAGRWDPSLALVMGGGLIVTWISYPLIFKRKAPILTASFALPTNNQLDPKLIGGAALFGTGWAISGLCPGPALANLGSLNPGVFAFVAMMLLGFVAQHRLSVFSIRHTAGLTKNQIQEKTQELCEEECVVD
jgi:uncharacterized protein